MNSFDVWLMDSEYCSECGTALSGCESDLCYDCQQDQWYDEDQDYYDGWFSDEEDTMNEEIPKPKDHFTIRLEFKPQDCWIGVYWRKTELFPWKYRHRWQRDIWICILPMLPIHIWWTRIEHE